MLDFEKLAEITAGKLVQFRNNSEIINLLTDSRKIVLPSKSVFFAISGERHDGHLFIKDLYNKGIRSFIIENDIELQGIPEANIIKVKNTISSLQKIAAYHRSQFTIPIIGITGSNAKTIVKEWLDFLLSPYYTIVKNPKSYNSQIGVPLSVWQIKNHHKLGIFEAGISTINEMQHLQQIIQPQVGIFTNIGTAHDASFKKRSDKIKEKLKLFENSEAVIYCLDHTSIHEEILKFDFQQESVEFFTWARDNPDATVNLLKVRNKKQKTTLDIVHRNRVYKIDIPFADEASIENLMHCLSLALYLKIDLNELKARILLIKNPSMRLELKLGINQCYLINDAYNNDLAGLVIALDFLNLQQQRSKKTVILSDVLQSGMGEEELYKNIADVLKFHKIDKLIGIGEVIGRNKNFYPDNSVFFENTEAFLQQKSFNFSNELILIKGARKFEFEKITSRLEQKSHGTVLEINLDAVSYNLNHYKSLLKPKTKIMAMVKAFAYGSGSTEIANILQFHRVDYLSVAYADEGVNLRKNGIHLPIMVLNPSPDTFEQLLQYDLEPNIYSQEILDQIISYLKSRRKKLKIHLALDTGMHRLGFSEEDLEMLIETIAQHNVVKVSSFYTHLAAADEPEEREFTLQQLKLFKTWTDLITMHLSYKPLKHALNTSGIINFPEYQMDMVRLGIGLYGVGINSLERPHLKTVSTLKTTISQIKNIKAGETIGYGRKGKAEKNIVIATIAIGYADGFNRKLSNGIGKVLIRNKLCPVIGNICMDMCMVDITGTEANIGDEVVIIGDNPSIYDLSSWLGTIPYEILTQIGERVKRVFFTE